MSIGLSNIKEQDSILENKEENVYKYSKNPFTPSGKMNRMYYFVYVVCLGLFSHVFDIYISKNSSQGNLTYLFFIYFTLLTFNFFIIKKRILDITNHNKKSWIYASLFITTRTILGIINQYLIYVLLPFGIYILCKESYGTQESYLGISGTSETKSNTVICNHCNKEVRKAKYCSNCGGQLDEM